MVSNTQLDKAGRLLREWWADIVYRDLERDEDDPAVDLAFEAVWGHRDRFSSPMTQVNVGLRYYIRRAGSEVVVAQRLKRMPRILEKLYRHQNMRMSQMQDVGGCRAILPSQEHVFDVLNGLNRNWDIITVDDLVAAPRATGYRAVHVIVRKLDVPIEVQLRTIGQQDWADEVERLDSLRGYGLKDGQGPPEVLNYTRELADVIAETDAGIRVDRERLDLLAILRAQMP